MNIRKKIVNRFIIWPAAAAAILFSNTLSFAGIVAPYFYTWGEGNSSYAVQSLLQAKQKAGVSSLTLAFELSGGAVKFPMT
jgi:hypothetical protein